MLRSIAAAFLIGYLPGALIFRLPWGNREQRARLEAEERGFWAALLSVVWSAALVLALALTRGYTFERLCVANLTVSALIAIACRGRLRYGRDEAPGATWSACLPLLLVALGLWLYFPPAEYVIGGKDPGVYLNEGIQIAQRGRLIVRDPVVAAVPEPLRNLFFVDYTASDVGYSALRFMGFFVKDLDDGRVVGQFPHLFPATVAIGYGLNGLSGARQAVGFWAIAGLLAVYFLGRRLFGRAAGLAAAGLLAINVAEVWFARYPNSELTMQALLLAAVLAFGYALEGSRRFFGALAAVLLGLLLFLRYEVVLAFATFTIAAVLAPVTRTRSGVSFFVMLTVVALAGFWYLTGPLAAYAYYPLSFTRDQGGWLLVGGGLLAAVGARAALRSERIAVIVRRLLPAGLAVVLTALAVYAYFFRQEGGMTAEHDAMAFRTFGWYLTPRILAVAVVGVAIVTATQFWRSPVFFLTFTAFSLFFFYKTRIVPEHFWAARRFLTMALPGTLLLLAGFLDWAIRQAIDRMPIRRRSTVAAILLGAAVAPIATTFWRQADPVRHHVEYAGVVPKLEALAGRFSDRDLLLVESRAAGSDLHILALPLAYIYAKNVLVLTSITPPKRMLEDFIAWAETRYATVYFLGGAGTDLLTKRISAVPLANDRFQIPEYESPSKAYPTGPRHKEFEYGLYRLSRATDTRSGPIDLQIGALDDLNVVRFYAREKQGDTGMMFRWTRALSTVLLLGVAPDAREVTVWMGNGGRPKQAPSPVVTISLEDRVLGSATLGDEIQPYRFEIPADVASNAAASEDPARLQLRVPTWNPASVLGGGDTRELGVIVTRVQVR